jgi:hypothetical protein
MTGVHQAHGPAGGFSETYKTNLSKIMDNLAIEAQSQNYSISGWMSFLIFH